MTEAEWREAVDCPKRMWEQVQDSARWTPRTLRLFVAASWASQADRLPTATAPDLRRRAEAFDGWAETGKLSRPFRISRGRNVIFFNRSAIDAVRFTITAPQRRWGEGWEKCREELCDYLRDIHGNPFRPVALDPSWLTEAVAALAAGIYAERAFDRLPVLADALEDAGCANPDVLGHCRNAGPHARGCWAVDLLLGKA
ncbi:MAG TPA: hypothetical protein VH092_09910 [Urbifossiella sp.]|nr:hypothetical protein [Urbifossiella sp.]